MLLKECARCHKLIPYGNTYCDECKPIVEEQKDEYKRKRQQRYNSKRDSRYTRFYKSKSWKMLSAKKLQATKYRCEECGRYATEVHHKDPIQTPSGWDKRFDYDGLLSVCVECHNKFHDRFKSNR